MVMGTAYLYCLTNTKMGLQYVGVAGGEIQRASQIHYKWGKYWAGPIS